MMIIDPSLYMPSPSLRRTLVQSVLYSTFLAMKTGKIVIASFIIGFFGMLIGALLKIMHWATADTWLAIGLISWAVFVVAAIYEVSTSKTINRTEKIMWIVGFVLMAGITGWIYVIIGRKRVVRNIITG